MKKNNNVTYIDFDKWNTGVIKVGTIALAIILFVEIILFLLFKPTEYCTKEQYFISFIVMPTIIEGLIILYLIIISKVLNKFLSENIISMLMIIGEIAFTLSAVAIHSSVPFMCIVLIHPIMLTSVYRSKFFGWFACFVSIIGYALIEFNIIPSVPYKIENTPFVYFIIFATLVVLTTSWTLSMKKINVEFDKNAEMLRNEANVMKYDAEMDSLTELYNHNSFYKKLNERIDMYNISINENDSRRSKGFSSIEAISSIDSNKSNSIGSNDSKIKDISIGNCDTEKGSVGTGNAENSNDNKLLHLIVVDIDNFKVINDTYGHVAGDNVIVSLANIIKRTLKEDDFAGRYGGEEFVGVYSNITQSEAINIAEGIKEECSNTIVKYKVNEDKEYKISYTVSIGLVSYTNEVKTGVQFFEYADKALYQAKNSGKNKVVLNMDL